MFNSGKIFTIHENPNRSDPADRIEVVREGFSFWAFVFGAVWLLAQRLWIPAALYIFSVVAIEQLGDWIGLADASQVMIQLGIQFLLGCHAYDLKRWVLARRGYTERGVVCAPSPMVAQQRVFATA